MDDKKTRIIEAAIDLFAKEGFWNTPTSRIAERAGVATGTLFNHFASKNILIDEVYLSLKREVGDSLAQGYPASAGVKERLAHLWERYVAWGAANPVRHLILNQLRISNFVSESAKTKVDQEFQFVLDLVAEGVRGKLLADLPPAYLCGLTLAQMEASIAFAEAAGLRGPALERHSRAGFAIAWKGISTR